MIYKTRYKLEAGLRRYSGNPKISESDEELDSDSPIFDSFYYKDIWISNAPQRHKNHRNKLRGPLPTALFVLGCGTKLVVHVTRSGGGILPTRERDYSTHPASHAYGAPPPSINPVKPPEEVEWAG